MKVAIIGSGMAGLTAGALLARAGHDVTVYEQFSRIGGVTATLNHDGFCWDLGPLLLEGFGPDDPGARILRELEVNDQVPVVRADRGIVFPDFSLWKPASYAGPYWRRDRLKELFPQDSDGIDRYYRFYDRIMNIMARGRRAEEASSLGSILLKLGMWWDFRPVRTMSEWSAQRLLEHMFRSEALRAVFTAILADIVVQPSRFPALGIPVFNGEHAFDTRIPLRLSPAGPRPGYAYIRGGCGKLVAAVAGALERRGGKILTGTAVQRIQVREGKAVGVVLDSGGSVPADTVIASGGARETFLELVGREHFIDDFVRSIDAYQYMESVFMVQIGIDFDPSRYQQAALCYYYGTYDVEGGVVRCLKGEYHEGRDGFLVYVPSLHSPDMAPSGHHAVTIYTIAPNTLKEGTWSERREEMADKLVECAERYIPGLRAHTKVRVILTPEDFRSRVHQRRHAFGGIAPVMGQTNPSHRTPIENLWFIGSQSESGGGVMAVMKGARKVANMLVARR